MLSGICECHPRILFDMLMTVDLLILKHKNEGCAGWIGLVFQLLRLGPLYDFRDFINHISTLLTYTSTRMKFFELPAVVLYGPFPA